MAIFPFGSLYVARRCRAAAWSSSSSSPFPLFFDPTAGVPNDPVVVLARMRVEEGHGPVCEEGRRDVFEVYLHAVEDFLAGSSLAGRSMGI